MLFRDRWIDSWTVVLCHPDDTMHQHNFLLSKRASRKLGADRARRDAEEFAETFSIFASVLYCGPTAQLPEDLKQGIAQHHRCPAAYKIPKWA